MLKQRDFAALDFVTSCLVSDFDVSTILSQDFQTNRFTLMSRGRSQLRGYFLAVCVLCLLISVAFLYCYNYDMIDYAMVDDQDRTTDCRDKVRSDTFVTVDELRLSMPCVFRSYDDLNLIGLDDVLFIMMASSVTVQRLKAVTETYGKVLKTLWFISDTTSSSYPNMITLPELQNRSTYVDAQHRQFRLLKRLSRIRKVDDVDPTIPTELRRQWLRAKWVFLIDDDTWVNTRAFQQFISQLNYNYPVAAGYVFPQEIFDRNAHGKCDDHENSLSTECAESMALRSIQNYDKMPGWLSGGGGMLLSKLAALLVGNAMYHRCQFYKVNDVTLALCLKELSILTIHSSKFHPGGYRPALFDKNVLNAAAVQDTITFHTDSFKEMEQLERCSTEKECFLLT